MNPLRHLAANKKVEEEEIPAPIVDQDPVGEVLLQTKEPLVQALKFLKPLEKAAPGMIDTWLLSFEVAIRRGESRFVSSLFRQNAKIFFSFVAQQKNIYKLSKHYEQHIQLIHHHQLSIH